MRTSISILQRRHQSQGGSAVVVLIALLSLMLVFVAANNTTLNVLRKNVKLVEKKQIQRLAASATNLPPVSGTNSPVSR